MLSRARLLPSGFIGPCLPSPAERSRLHRDARHGRGHARKLAE